MIGSKRILEVGCGTGDFLHMLLDQTNLSYFGFDFSKVAIEKARKRTGYYDIYEVKNGLLKNSYSGEFDAVVCTEVLEHIEEDIKVISHWKSGVNIICSVPNFDADSHVRYFNNKDEVFNRYEKYIDIKKIKLIKKPILTNISLRNLLRHLRWKRNSLIGILNVLGFTDFDKNGGWFLFSGVKK